MSAKSKASDKLARLAAGFGNMAGAGPAESALIRSQETVVTLPPAVTATEAPVIVITKPPHQVPQAVPTPSVEVVIPETSVEKSSLTRNVVFTFSDQIELTRLEDILRAAGVRNPTIADAVRLALRTSSPSPQEAQLAYKEAKALDSRRKECKTL
jgi:hypothetical protein